MPLLCLISVTQVYMKNQPKNCDKEKEPWGSFGTGYGSSDHLILCPIELFTEYFMTIVLQLPGPRSVTKMPNTSVGVCLCPRTQVQPDSVDL
jgi:hypothetical protein